MFGFRSLLQSSRRQKEKVTFKKKGVPWGGSHNTMYDKTFTNQHSSAATWDIHSSIHDEVHKIWSFTSYIASLDIFTDDSRFLWSLTCTNDLIRGDSWLIGHSNKTLFCSGTVGWGYLYLPFCGRFWVSFSPPGEVTVMPYRIY